MRARRGLIIALLVPIALAGAAVAGFAPVVRSRVAREADKRHVILSYRTAHPHWGAIELVDLDIAPEGVEGVHASLQSVVISLSSGLSVRAVDVHGGSLDVSGDAADVLQRLRDWRARASAGAPPEADAARVHTPIHADGISLHAKDAAGAPYFDFHGVTFDRGGEIAVAPPAVDPPTASTLSAATPNPGGTSFGAEAGTVSLGGTANLDLGGGTIELTPEGTLHRAHADRLDVAWHPAEPPRDADPHSDAHPDPDDPPAPGNGAAIAALTATPLPGAGHAATAVSAANANANAAPSPATPLVAMPDLPALRAKLGHVAKLLGERLPDKSTIDVNGFSATLQGAHPLSIGPAPLIVSHAGDAIEIRFRSADTPRVAAGPASTPLTVQARLPLGTGDVIASLSGGPIALSDLGVKDGAAGLRDTGRATVSGEGRLLLDGAGESLSFDGGAEVSELALQDARLAPDELHHLDIGVRARGTLNKSGVVKLEEAQAQVGAIKLRIHGDLAADTAHTSASINFDVPTTSCEAMLSSVPAALLPTLAGAHMSGTFAATGNAVFDTRHLDDLKLDYHADDGCRMDTVPRDLVPDRFSHSFLHRVYGPDGEMREEETGPGTPRWANLDDISPFLQVAVLTTEDGGFPRHHGFNHAAIRGALIANLKAHRFVRGASTITMQLAKNLFLTRDKTLGRKLEELILTDYLEQVFQKDEMMELYLNIIEFGPDIYGARQAAQHYFGREPDELNLAECLFLSSIMPSPIRFHKMYERGEVPDGWLKHLRQLMKTASKVGTITPSEYEDGIKEVVVFHKEGDPAPPARTPAISARQSGLSAPGADGWDTPD